MKTVSLGSTGQKVPAVVLGCMRLAELEENAVSSFLSQAVDLGITYFDHADIYGGGACEEIFGKAFPMTNTLREKVIIQSKCGIVPGKMYDLSKTYILKQVEASLKRLHTEYLDVLLLHRPDALMEPEEIAGAMEELKTSGKVRNFGVSNMKTSQIRLLQKCVDVPIQINQLQLSITNATLINNGMHVNRMADAAVERDGSVLDYCRLKEITVQAWSPFQSRDGVFLGNPEYAQLNQKMEEIAAKYGVTPTAIAVAWILRHPANMQVLAGTMNPKRLEECARAADIRLSREEWYEIYMAAGNELP